MPNILDLPSELLSAILELLVPSVEDARRPDYPGRSTNESDYNVDTDYDFDILAVISRPFIQHRQVCKRFQITIDHLLFGPAGFDQKLLATLANPERRHQQHKLGKIFPPPLVESALRVKLDTSAEAQTPFVASLAEIAASTYLSELPKTLVIPAVARLAALWRTTAMYEAICCTPLPEGSPYQLLMATISVAAYLGEVQLLRKLLAEHNIKDAEIGYDSEASSTGTITDLCPPYVDYWLHGYRDWLDRVDISDEGKVNMSPDRVYTTTSLIVGRPLWASTISGQVETARVLLKAGLFEAEVPTYLMQDIFKDRTVQQLLLRLPQLVLEGQVLAGRRCKFLPESVFPFIAQGRIDIIRVLLTCGLSFYGRTRPVLPTADEDVSEEVETLGLGRGQAVQRGTRLRGGRGRNRGNGRGRGARYTEPYRPTSPEMRSWGKEISLVEVRSALFIDAVCAGQEDLASMLLEDGIHHSFRYRPVYRETFLEANPLGIAAHHGYITLMLKLLELGANVEGIVDLDQEPETEAFLWVRSRAEDPFPSPVSFAAMGSSIDAARFLLQLGADVNAVRSRAISPLHAACQANDLAMAQELLLWRADPNRNVEFSRNPLDLERSTSPLVAAVKNRNTEMVALLLKHGADPNAGPIQDRVGEPRYFCSALAYAVARNCSEIAELLVEAGADVSSIGYPAPQMRAPDNITAVQLAHFFGQTHLEAYLAARSPQDATTLSSEYSALDLQIWLEENLPVPNDLEIRRKSWSRYRAFLARLPRR